MYYFVRVNGHTLHNNPTKPELLVPGEPPLYPQTYFNALNFCLRHNIVRIGWPDAGDLTSSDRAGALARGYDATDFQAHQQEYLRAFAAIQEKSVIVMPDKEHPGDVYVGKVTKPYFYFHDVPVAPYEYSHRLGVHWLRNSLKEPICFQAHDFNIGIQGGFWMRAFHALADSPSGRAAIPSIAQKLKAG